MTADAGRAEFLSRIAPFGHLDEEVLARVAAEDEVVDVLASVSSSGTEALRAVAHAQKQLTRFVPLGASAVRADVPPRSCSGGARRP